jgi:hypothetical protein
MRRGVPNASESALAGAAEAVLLAARAPKAVAIVVLRVIFSMKPF